MQPARSQWGSKKYYGFCESECKVFEQGNQLDIVSNRHAPKVNNHVKKKLGDEDTSSTRTLVRFPAAWAVFPMEAESRSSFAYEI